MPGSDPPASAESPLDAVRRRVAELEEENADIRRNADYLNDTRAKLGELAYRVSMITTLSHQINTLDLNKIAEIAVERIPHLVNAKYCSFFLYDKESDELILQRHNHPCEITQRIAIKHHKDTVMGMALDGKRIVHIRDLNEFEKDSGVQMVRTFADKYATQSCICAPLLAGDDILGVLNLADKNDGTSFDEMNDLPPIEQLSHILGMALRNCALYHEVERQARTDSLTRLSNRRELYEKLKGEIHRSSRYVRNLSLLMIDVDDFKGINDTFGHRAGDYVLKELATVILSYIRGEDTGARYGGDEIAILLPETPLPGAQIVAGRLMELIRRHRFVFEGQPLQVAISLGIAEFLPSMSLNDLVNSADNALYLAKKAGKNRIETAQTKQ